MDQKRIAEIEAKAKASLSQLTVPQLKDCAERLYHTGDEGDLPFSWVLQELENRLNESEFVRFCGKVGQ